MKGLTKILSSVGLILLTPKRVDRWTKKRNIDKLEYAVKHGLFNIRKKAVEGLGKIGTEDCIPILKTALDDKIEIVSMTAINMLEKNALTKGLETIIENKRDYWSKRNLEEAQKLKNKRVKLINQRHWKRTSKETFENLKERLKRPIR